MASATKPFYVALLRGINVGGNNLLPMKDLAAIFAKAGCSDVSTYIQSGNVVFRADPALAAKLPELISKAIAKGFKMEIPLIVRSAAELRKVAAAHPLAKPGADPKYLNVGFLAKRPDAAALAGLDPKRSPPDVFVVKGSEIYIHFPNGGARSKLTNQYFDSKLGTVSTYRNWNTVLKLLEMAAKD